MTPPIYISFLKKVRQKGLLFGSTFLKGGTKKMSIALAPPF
jgi:hypothetical protein